MQTALTRDGGFTIEKDESGFRVINPPRETSGVRIAEVCVVREGQVIPLFIYHFPFSNTRVNIDGQPAQYRSDFFPLFDWGVVREAFSAEISTRFTVHPVGPLPFVFLIWTDGFLEAKLDGEVVLVKEEASKEPETVYFTTELSELGTGSHVLTLSYIHKEVNLSADNEASERAVLGAFPLPMARHIPEGRGCRFENEFRTSSTGM